MRIYLYRALLAVSNVTPTASPLFRERLGAAMGKWLAPLAKRVSSLRKARTFHPDGITFHAHVEPLFTGEFETLAVRLSGPALARFSGALWRRGTEHFDVLGIALRFRRNTRASSDPEANDQDLLFATVKSPFTLLFGPFTTRTTDFFKNRYWAVSPFSVEGVGNLKFRLSPGLHFCAPDANREEKLLAAVKAGQAQFYLQTRQTFTRKWRNIATVQLIKVAELDEAKLRFSPFRTGRGIIPRGFVHALRRAAYPASQEGRSSEKSSRLSFRTN